MKKKVLHQVFPFNSHVPTAPEVALPTSEDEELSMAMAMSASLQSAAQDRPLCVDMYAGSITDASASPAITVNSSSHDKSYASEASTSLMDRSKFEVQTAGPSTNPATLESSSPVSIPAATDDGQIQYPSLDTSHIDIPSPSVAVTSTSRHENREEASASSCTICLDAPVEAACIPCGHMVGCMSCLNEIDAKKWGCPVCRTKIDQVVRIYAV